MEKLLNKACDALETLDKANNLNIMDTADRKLVLELVGLKKDLLKVMMLEDELNGTRSSRSYRGGSYGDGSYAGGSYAQDGSYGDGSYGGGWSGRHRDRMGRFSRSAAAGEMMDHVERAMSAAPDDATRQKMQRFMNELNQML